MKWDTLCKKCPNTEFFFWSVFSCIRTEFLSRIPVFTLFTSDSLFLQIHEPAIQSASAHLMKYTITGQKWCYSHTIGNFTGNDKLAQNRDKLQVIHGIAKQPAVHLVSKKISEVIRLSVCSKIWACRNQHA